MSTIERKNACLAILLVLGLILIPFIVDAAPAAQQLPSQPIQLKSDALQQTGKQPLQQAAVPVFNVQRNANLLRNIGKQVTIEGQYYDGSIPMLLDDIRRVYVNLPLPPECYVPLTGTIPKLKWGDRVRVTGVLEKPTAQLSHLARESAVLRIPDTRRVQLIKAGAAIPRLPFRKIDISKIKPVQPGAFTPIAILIAGGANAASNYGRYWSDLSWMYSILLTRGYAPSNIIVVYADGTANDNSMPVNYAATKANIATVFNSVASRMNQNKTLYIMTNDHGSSLPGGHTGLCLWNGETMSDTEFAAEVDKIQQYKNIIVQMEQCYSGGFVAPLTRANRIVMSACAANQLSWSTADGLHNEFTYWYLSALSGSVAGWDSNSDGKCSILEAYNFAKSKDSRQEAPQFEGNGTVPCVSGVVAATSGEGTLAAATFVGD
jgi:hypothetical protein